MVGLSLDPPPSSRDGRASRRGGGSLSLYLTLAVVAAAGFTAGRWTAPGGRFPIPLARGSGPATSPPPAAPSAVAPSRASSAAPGPAAPGDSMPAPSAPVPIAPATPAAAAPVTPSPASGPRRVAATLQGALEESIAAALPAEDRALGEELTQVVNRLLVWDVQVARDGRRGDRIEVVYWPPGPPAAGEPVTTEPVVEALRFASQKLARTVAAYRYRVPGARWPRYFRPDGSELEERLVDTPVDDYDQITSLLRDGRRHKGVDFRTPVGTPVHATFDAVIERRNWNFAGNGNCLDMRDLASGKALEPTGTEDEEVEVEEEVAEEDP